MKPGYYRRQGRKAFHPGEDPDMLNPYRNKRHWIDKLNSDLWLEGWKEAQAQDDHDAEEASSECPHCGEKLC